jgi:hypothetical protein
MSRKRVAVVANRTARHEKRYKRSRFVKRWRRAKRLAQAAKPGKTNDFQHVVAKCRR